MAISKDEISMLNPKQDGSNYGVPLNWNQKEAGNAATNYNELMDAIKGTKNIEKALSCVTTSKACGQDWPNSAVKDGGINLGKPHNGND